MYELLCRCVFRCVLLLIVLLAELGEGLHTPHERYQHNKTP